MKEEVLARLTANPPPPLPKVSPRALLVLRRVHSGDPYRDKRPGIRGTRDRLRTLHGLEQHGLIRLTRDGFWRATKLGNDYLALHPAKGYK